MDVSILLIMFRDIFKKADIILLAVLLAGGIFASIAFARSGSAGGLVSIKAGGKAIASYSLDQDRTVIVSSDGSVSDLDVTDTESVKPGYNTIQIKDGIVSVIEADCHNQVCVNHKPISHEGESIICLPHKMVVEIESGKGDGDVDTIAQ